MCRSVIISIKKQLFERSDQRIIYVFPYFFRIHFSPVLIAINLFTVVYRPNILLVSRMTNHYTLLTSKKFNLHKINHCLYVWSVALHWSCTV